MDKVVNANPNGKHIWEMMTFQGMLIKHTNAK